MQKNEIAPLILFPHQLLAEHKSIIKGQTVYLIEEWLFFRHYKFHKQKLAFHRASMKTFASQLEDNGVRVNYIDSNDSRSDVRIFLSWLNEENIQKIEIIDPVDDWLRKRIWNHRGAIEIIESEHPMFLNSREQLKTFFKEDQDSFFQASFYKWQRESLCILVDEDQKPIGGKWSFDTENRKKYPKSKTPPPVQYPDADSFWEEAIDYVETNFADNPGDISKAPHFPFNRKASRDWFRNFLENRFAGFGDYEDAIVRNEHILHHSVLTPMLNVGLLLPEEIIEQTLKFHNENDLPLNSTEGFIRQIIGWREFMRGIYEFRGVESRTRNFWNFKRKIPTSFYDGTTGVLPIDETIKKVLKTGYCHHIERLMVLGNFMLLCEFDPDEVYRWFMELFIDAYDWVMVPNVYGMSQFADGGIFATKPYIGGSNYIKKMSDYPKGVWEEIWDGLFWRFIDEHYDFFRNNHRTAMMARNLDRMPKEKLQGHLQVAQQFLEAL